MTADLLFAPSAGPDSSPPALDVPARREAPVAFAAPRARHAALEDRLMVREEEPDWPRAAAAAPADDSGLDASEFDKSELAALLAVLRELAGRGDISPGNVETWSRIEIAPGVALSIRGVADEDAAVLEAVARRLRERLADRCGD